MERLFGSIPEILKGLGHDGGAAEAVVFAAWKHCAGNLISDRTEPIEFFENRLVVAVRDATWRVHLEDLSPQLVARLNSTLDQGTVKFVEFRVEPAAFESPAQTANEVENEAADAPQSLKDAAENIADTDLRKTFLSAAAVYLAKK